MVFRAIEPDEYKRRKNIYVGELHTLKWMLNIKVIKK